MYSSDVDIKVTLGDFKIEGRTFRYSSFMGRLYNFCLELGFTPGNILPSRAYCSDESQGYPILIAKHFGSFPFNHGRVGGVVSTDRHGPFAEHGEELVIIHASHVGYDPDTHEFGIYRRLQTANCDSGSSCGKIRGVLDWYLSEYDFAKHNIFLEHDGDKFLVTIDNQLLRQDREEGLFLNMERIVGNQNNGNHYPIRSLSTSKCFVVSRQFQDQIGALWPVRGREPILDLLSSDLFRFKRDVPEDPESDGHLEKNLLSPMSCIVTSKLPLLVAAQVNTQVEFDRTFRSIVKAHEFGGKKVLFISGLNIDISPGKGQLFPLTKFVPWAAYFKDRDEKYNVMEQTEVYESLLHQKEDNPDEVNLEEAIQQMAHAEEIIIRLSDDVLGH